MYGLGIDAGGTYTDTAVIDMDTGVFVAGNKALTTRSDLSIGIRNSLAGIDRSILSEVALTSLSSTLATNSVVEGKGCRVGLICIGKSYNGNDADMYFQVDGRFSMNGKEEESLGIRQITEALEAMDGKVDALAIAGYISVRWPEHEERCAAMAARRLKVPIVLAHTLTSKLGFEQRAVTAVMNARLIPTIKELMDSVKVVLKEAGVTSPLMVVKGDGSVMREDVAALKPVETILSGPASSITGARALTRITDAAVVDIGGTTTDIGLLRNGIPKIDPEGARIAGKRTRVMAAEIATYGIGGDSRIVVNGREIILTPVRAIPLCVAASLWPSVKSSIAELRDRTGFPAPENYPVPKMLQETEFIRFTHEPQEGVLSRNDLMFLNAIRAGPRRISDVAGELDLPPHAFNVSLMESRGFITRIAVTPTDILCAEGTYDAYDTESSRIAVDYLARKCGMDAGRFIEHVKTMITEKIAASLMETILLRENDTDTPTPEQEYLIERALHSKGEYSIGFRLNIPIVGIGAPTGAWLPRVADMLGTELVLPENSSIGNAIGAITGYVSESAEVTVRATPKDPVENPECDVYTGSGVRTFPFPDEAVEFAGEEASRIAVKRACASGASNPDVTVSVEEKVFELADGKKVFRGATVVARATGKPDLGH